MTNELVRVLVVEDEERMASLLEQGLSEEGYFVTLARDGSEGLALAGSCRFDVVVLDLGLPQVDGLTIARRLRETGNQTPLLMLTARDALSDIVSGLNTGADEYVTKPFSFDILLARLRAVSRRGPIPQGMRLQLADLTLDTETRRVTRSGQSINLTAREYSLLELFLRNAGRPIMRQTILESVWGFDADVEENTLEAFVRLLRNKIDYGFQPKLIHTVRGVGYCLRLPDRDETHVP
jgi:DNA-binding response OmpR family regulator